MKRCNVNLFAGILTGLSLTLVSCERKYSVESVIHADGSIDRTIVLTDADSGKVDRNIFGAGKDRGWETTIRSAEQKNAGSKDDNKFTFTFHKHYSSAADANAEMNVATDTLFRIRSDFKKTFRWFYTYIRYSDTYISLNQFRKVSTKDYFTREDYDFIDRLPAEGRSISRADSLYLSALNTKIFDQYGTRVLFEEYFGVMGEVLEKNKVDRKWIDTLNLRKERLYRELVKKGGESVDDDLMATFLVDSLHVPLSPAVATADYKTLSAGLMKRIDFVSDANSGKYTHVINMPWEVVDTNADSVAATVLSWNPPVTKFLLTDYTMYAESRKLNLWTWAASVVVISAAVFALYKRRAKA